MCPDRGGIIIGYTYNGTEILYLNKETFYDEKSNIRGGIPILFPICGVLKDKKYKINGKEYLMNNHGFARNSKFQVIDKNTNNEASLTLLLKSDPKTLQCYPFDFELIIKYTLKEGKLTIYQQYTNYSNEKMPVHIGFHPYFYTEDKNITDYQVDTSKYFDSTENIVKVFSKDVMDINYCENSKFLVEQDNNNISFVLPSISKNITMKYSNEFKYIVLWTEKEKPFVCIEPWTGKPGTFNTGEDLICIEPSTTLNLALTLEIDAK